MRRRREGFSLLEVMLATAILLGAIAVLGELARLGRLNASAARDETQAELLCESKLNEILAGAVPATPHAEQPLEEAPGWQLRVDREPTEHEGLVALRVTVSQDLPAAKRPVRFSLVRWFRQPVERTPSGLPMESPAALAPTSLPMGE